MVWPGSGAVEVGWVFVLGGLYCMQMGLFGVWVGLWIKKDPM